MSVVACFVKVLLFLPFVALPVFMFVACVVSGLFKVLCVGVDWFVCAVCGSLLVLRLLLCSCVVRFCLLFVGLRHCFCC